MPTTLKPPPPTTTWPHYPIQPVADGLAAAYGQLTLAERRDLSDFFSPFNHYTKVPALINDARNMSVRPELKAFYVALELLHTAVKPNPSEWPQVLGAVAEETVRLLLDQKYPGRVETEDKCLDVHDTSTKPPILVATTQRRSFDAVAWDTVADCGELHEVKVSILNFDDAKKIRAMRTFREKLAAHTSRSNWIGLASFLDTLERAEEKVRTLIGLWEMPDPLNLDFLVPETYAAWVKQHFL